MQNAGNQNARRLVPEESDVLAHLHAINAGAEMTAGAA